MFLSKNHYNLLSQLIRRDIASRNKGSILGNAWTIITSAGTLAMYTFVFTKIFAAKWPQGNNENSLTYALNIYAGLIVFNLVSDVLSRAPSIITENSNLIQKVIFPSELLPLVTLATSLYFYLINSIILILASAFINGSWNASVIVAPFMIAPLLAMTLGASYIISSLAVYIKDVRQVVAMAIPLLMFLSPVFYSSSSLSGPFKVILNINPLASAIDASRSLYFQYGTLDIQILCWQTIGGIIVLGLGHWIFMRLKKGFADAL